MTLRTVDLGVFHLTARDTKRDNAHANRIQCQLRQCRRARAGDGDIRAGIDISECLRIDEIVYGHVVCFELCAVFGIERAEDDGRIVSKKNLGRL